MKYFLSTDESSHWYVIPTTKRDDWAVWVDDEDNWEVPDYAFRIGGSPDQIEFENPCLDGKLCFDWIGQHGTEIKPIDVTGKPMAHLFKKNKKL